MKMWILGSLDTLCAWDMVAELSLGQHKLT